MASRSIENISGIVLSGSLKPDEPIRKLIEGFPITVPILSYTEDTFPTATKIDRIHAKISPDDTHKIARALALFEKNVDMQQLENRLFTKRAAVITPKMHEYARTTHD